MAIEGLGALFIIVVLFAVFIISKDAIENWPK